VSIPSITAAVEITAQGGLRYHVSYRLQETSGRSAATFSSVSYTISNPVNTGVPLNPNAAHGTLSGAVRVPSGGTIDLGPVDIDDSSVQDLGLFITISGTFTDDGGRTGTASALGQITLTLPPSFTPPSFKVGGTVTDGTSHGVLPNVRIELKPLAPPLPGAAPSGTTSATATTNAAGTYVLPNISVGAYTLSASAAGYQTTTTTIFVASNDVLDDIVLQRVGASSSAVRSR